MIDLYYYPSPNGLKIAIMVEECGLPYQVVPVDIGGGEQFRPEYLALNPNNKIPTIVDQDTGASVFESGAILIYLAEKSGQFLPASADERIAALSWLFWQSVELTPWATKRWSTARATNFFTDRRLPASKNTNPNTTKRMIPDDGNYPASL